ncbi:hypothetical protein [Bufonid herpesvirus 1]|uniref:hypothetical protein n=1 Tax=Bufonid herpesvirus 1 TaxID=2282206 RepID=UPI000EB73163|nr:hypothetical protein [Bufonid herpesvirus 1]AXF48553.1 hypothetical protein [Bufonid herpesvirus 1]
MSLSSLTAFSILLPNLANAASLQDDDVRTALAASVAEIKQAFRVLPDKWQYTFKQVPNWLLTFDNYNIDDLWNNLKDPNTLQKELKTRALIKIAAAVRFEGAQQEPILGLSKKNQMYRPASKWEFCLPGSDGLNKTLYSLVIGDSSPVVVLATPGYLECADSGFVTCVGPCWRPSV